MRVQTSVLSCAMRHSSEGPTHTTSGDHPCACKCFQALRALKHSDHFQARPSTSKHSRTWPARNDLDVGNAVCASTRRNNIRDTWYGSRIGCLSTYMHEICIRWRAALRPNKIAAVAEIRLVSQWRPISSLTSPHLASKLSSPES